MGTMTCRMIKKVHRRIKPSSGGFSVSPVGRYRMSYGQKDRGGGFKLECAHHRSPARESQQRGGCVQDQRRTL